MKKAAIITLLLFGGFYSAIASHITGGEMYYTLVSTNGGMHIYSVTLKLYMRCNSGRQFPDPAIVGVFDRETFARIQDISVAKSQELNISLTNNNPCITNPPAVCYDVAYYFFTITLPSSVNGYILSSSVNYRIAGISNLFPGSGNIGATYTAEIPGTAAAANNSAHFTGSDLVIVCANNSFTYSFAAEDGDNDILQYSFCEAYQSGTTPGTGPPRNPPYQPVPYYTPSFSSSMPLASNVQIHPATGLITGTAPPVGVYVVTVCVNEIRNGVVIATQRKDLQIHITDCEIAAASLEPGYMLCGNTQTMAFMNLSNSPLITSYNWFINDNTGNTIYSSASPTVNYTFADTGIYSVKLVINRGVACSDSAVSPVKVYPGFNPDFTSTGICITKPTLYTDRTTSVYGAVNSWSWDFGEPGIILDVSNLRNPVYTYPTMGIKNISLTATDTKGCKETIIKSITVIDKPPLNLLFKDTLICINDPVQLQSSSPGIFSWSPNVNIINAGTAAPTVRPTVTTMYYVDLDDNGCLNRDSVKVRVTDHVNLQAMADTTICSGDAAQLRIISDGFQYAWTPAAQLNNASLPDPVAITNTTTTYRVTANIGSCVATEQIVVTAIPYPLANAGPDLTICYNAATQLNGQSDGRTIQWSPASLLNNAAILNPQTRQLRNSTLFTLVVYDIRGCPKPGRDTILVTVLPKINASAGSDTAVITGQPLQLNASGGEFYIWRPALNLSDDNIPNPVAVFNSPSSGLLYKVLVYDAGGCIDSSYILIKVFATGPTIFVPTAFTPNGDARNDLLKPVAVGMSAIEYFKVFNRWGQLVFSTSTNGHGWDGKTGGQIQPTNTFTWIVKAIDYQGRSYFQKGVTTLIR